jgi:hypothetical protein
MDTEEASTIVVHDTIYTVAQENSDGLTIKAGMYVVADLGENGEVILEVGMSYVKADTAHFHIVDDVTRKEAHPSLTHEDVGKNAEHPSSPKPAPKPKIKAAPKPRVAKSKEIKE